MKYTVVSMAEVAADPTHRLDPEYWIAKKEEACEEAEPEGGGGGGEDVVLDH